MENLTSITSIPNDLIDLPLEAPEEPQSNAGQVQVPSDLQDLPSDFKGLFGKLSTDFQTQFKRPFRVTTQPGTPGYKNLHKKLHNSNAADIGGNDLSDDEASWIVNQGIKYGLNVKDYRKNWKQIGGTAPHIHVDDDFGRVQYVAPTSPQIQSQEINSTQLPTDLVDLPIEESTPQSEPISLKPPPAMKSTRQMQAQSQFKKLLPTLNLAAQEIGQFESLKEQAAQEKAQSTGYLDNQWYKTLQIAQQKALEIQSKYGKHVEVGNLADWPYIKPKGWSITESGKPNFDPAIVRFSQAISTNQQEPEQSLEDLKHQLGDKQIESGLAASVHLPTGFNLQEAERRSEYPSGIPEQHIGEYSPIDYTFSQWHHRQEQKDIGAAEDASHPSIAGWPIINAVRHAVNNFVVAGAGETLWNIGGAAFDVLRGKAITSEETRHFLNGINQAAQDITDKNDGDNPFNNFLYQAGRMAPKMILPGGIVGFGTAEALDALGHGASPDEALKQGLISVATARLAHVFGISAAAIPSVTQSYTIGNAIEGFSKQWLAYSTAPALVHFLTTGETPDKKQAAYDLAFGALFSLYGARVQDLDPNTPLTEFEPVLGEMKSHLVESGKMKPEDADQYIRVAYANAVIKARNQGVDPTTIAKNIREGAKQFWVNKLEWLNKYNKNAPKQLDSNPEVEFESGLKEAIRQAKSQGVEVTPEYLASKFGLTIEKADVLINEVTPVETQPIESAQTSPIEEPDINGLTPEEHSALLNALYSDEDIAAMSPEQARSKIESFQDLYPQTPQQTPEVKSNLPGVVYRSDNGAALEILDQVGEAYRVRNEKGRTYLIHQNATFLPEQVTSEGKGEVVLNKQTNQPLTILGTRGQAFIVKNEVGKIYTLHKNMTIPASPEFLSKEESTVPETPHTITAQMNALAEGRKGAVLITPGESMPVLPDNMVATSTPVGTFIHSPSISPRDIIEAVATDNYGGLLGNVAPKPEEGEPSVTVTARDLSGRELQSAVVPPEYADLQDHEFRQIYPHATVVMGGDDLSKAVLDHRLENQSEKTESPENNQIEKATEIVLNPPGSVLARLSFGNENLIGEEKDIYTTETSRGKKYKFSLYKYELPDGRQRWVLSAGDPHELIDAGLLFRNYNGKTIVESIHAGVTGFSGLGGVLARRLAKTYPNIVGDINAPLSSAGRKATSKLPSVEQEQRGLTSAETEAANKARLGEDMVAVGPEELGISAEKGPLPVNQKYGSKIEIPPQEMIEKGMPTFGASKPQSLSMADAVAIDPHAQENASILASEDVQGLNVYRGGTARTSGHVYISTDEATAKSHGAVTKYNLKPGARVYPDPEIEGFAGDTLNGKESLLGSPEKQLRSIDAGSAVVNISDLIPVLSKEKSDIYWRGSQHTELGKGDFLGVFLTSDKISAQQYGEARPYLVSANNLLDFDSSEAKDIASRFLDIHPEDANYVNQEDDLWAFPPKNWTRYLRSLGYDGTKYGEDIFVFDSQKVQSTHFEESKPTPQSIGLDLRNKLREKHGTDLSASDLITNIPSFHVEMKKAGLDAQGQLEAFRTMGFNFKDPVQMIGTIRGTQSELGRIQRLDIKYKSVGKLIDYRVLGRFPGGEKILVMTPNSDIKIIQSPLGQTGNTRIKGEVPKDLFCKIPSIKWQEIGMQGDAWPTKAEIHRVNPAIDDVLDLTDEELQDNFPEVWRRVQEAQDQLGNAAGKEFLSIAYKEGDGDDNDSIQESRDRLHNLFNANIRPNNTSQWLYDTAVVVGNDILKLHPERNDWEQRVTERLGDDIKPHLNNVWDAINGRAPMFFSPLERAIKTELPNKGQAAQIKGIIRKAGVSDDEMKWTGFDEFLKDKAMKEQSITRQEALDFFQKNQVNLTERVFGQEDLIWKPDGINRWITEVSNGQMITLEYDEGIRSRPWSVEGAGVGPFGAASRLEAEEKAKNAIGHTTKFTSHTTPGGANNREITLSLPAITPRDKKYYDLRAREDELRRQAHKYEASIGNRESTEQDRAVIHDLISEANDLRNEASQYEGTSYYKVPHPHTYGVPEADINRIAIIRVNDRISPNNERILHVDEFQDDLQNEIQRSKNKIKELEGGEAKNKKYGILGNSGREEGQFEWDIEENDYFRFDTESEAKEFLRETNSQGRVAIIGRESSALKIEKLELDRLQSLLPFRGKSHELAMKYALGYAINHGYDMITWATGRQVADRYSLRRPIKYIHWMKDDDGNVRIRAFGEAAGDNLLDETMHLGEIAKRFGVDVFNRISNPNEWNGRIDDLDLGLGGEGKLTLYDQIIPDFMRKYIKKWNGVVGKTNIPTDRSGVDVIDANGYNYATLANNSMAEDYIRGYNESERERGVEETDFIIRKNPSNNVDVHTLSITPPMRDSILRSGQSLFGSSEGQPNEVTEAMMRLKDQQVRKRRNPSLNELNDILSKEKQGTELESKAYHGSPYHFDKFTLDHIGKGEGAQAYGWGLYFASNKAVGEFYRDKLTQDKLVTQREQAEAIYQALEPLSDGIVFAGKTQKEYTKDSFIDAYGKNELGFDDFSRDVLNKAEKILFPKGRLYSVDLKPQEDEYLAWDKPLKEQPEKIQQALKDDPTFKELLSSPDKKTMENWGDIALQPFNGMFLYKGLSQRFAKEHSFGKDDLKWSGEVPNDQAASKYLLSLGIKGVKYLEGASRAKGEGNYNYVIFDDADIAIQEIERRNNDIVNNLRNSSPEANSMITTAETGLGKQMTGEAINRASRSGRAVRILSTAGEAVLDYRKNSNRLYVNHVGEGVIKIIRQAAYGSEVSNVYGVTFDVDKLKDLSSAAQSMKAPLNDPEAIGVLDDLTKIFKSSINKNEPLVITDYSNLTGPGVRTTLKHEEVHRVDLMIRDAFNGVIPDVEEIRQLPHMDSLTRRISGKMGYRTDPRVVAMEAIARISTGDNEELELTPDEEVEFLDSYYTLMADTYHEDVLDQYKLITNAARKVRDEVKKRYESISEGLESTATTVSGMEGGRQGRTKEASGIDSPRQAEDSYAYLERKISDGNLGRNPIEDSYHISVVTGYESIRDNPKIDRDEWKAGMIRQLGERARPHLDSVWNLISGKAPIFYSPVQNLITSKVPNKASVEQVRGILKGISEDELKWSGLNDLLKEKEKNKESITKQELLDHLAVNNISVKTIISGATIKHLDWDNIPDSQNEFRYTTKDSTGYSYVITPSKSKQNPFMLIISAPAGNVVQTTSTNSLEAAHGLAESLRYDKKSPEEIAKSDIALLEQEGFAVEENPEAMGEVGFWSLDQHGDRENLMFADELPMYLRSAATRIIDAFAMRTGGTRYSEYKLEGGKSNSYVEIKLSLPVKDRSLKELPSDYTIEKPRKGGHGFTVYDSQGRDYGYGETEEAAREDALRMINSMRMDNPNEGAYQSPHWDEPNIITHIRGDSREHTDGVEGFVIDETQSDWSNASRKENLLLDQKGSGMKNIPDAPLLKQWPLLTVKQSIRHAVDQGLSRLSIVGARVHIDRWGTERAVWQKVPLYQIRSRSRGHLVPNVLGHQPASLWRETADLDTINQFLERTPDKEDAIVERVPDYGWKFQFKAQEGGQAGGINLEQEGLARGLISSGDSVIIRSKDDLLKEIKRNRASENAEAIADKLWNRMSKEDEGVSWPRAEGQLAHYGETSDYIKQRFPNRPDLLKFAWDRGDGKQSESFMPIAFRDVAKPFRANISMTEIDTEEYKSTDLSPENYYPTYSLDISPSMSNAIIRTGQPLYGSSVDDPIYVLDAKSRMTPQGKKNIIDMGIVVGHDILSKETEFKSWQSQILSQLGESIRPHLDSIWSRLSEAKGIELESKKPESDDETKARLSALFDELVPPTPEPQTSVDEATHPRKKYRPNDEYFEPEEGFEVVHPTFAQTLKESHLLTPWRAPLHAFRELMNFQRAWITGPDLSGTLRQNLIPSVAMPYVGPRAFVKQVQAFVMSRDKFEASMKELHSQPDFALTEQMGIEYTNAANRREELFRSPLAEFVPWIRMSDQAMTAELNWSRYWASSLFAKQLKEGVSYIPFVGQWLPIGRLQGIDIEKDPDSYYAAGRFVNAITGRGDMHNISEAMNDLLNTGLFSTRMQKARLDLTNPFYYIRMPKQARIIALRKMFEFASLIMGILTLAALAGLKVTKDPDDPDFGKLVVGHTHYDITAGYASYIRMYILSARNLYRGQYKKTIEQWAHFFRGKLAPFPAAAINLYQGKDYINRPTDVPTEAARLITPMFVSNLSEAYKDSGIVGAMKASTEVLGLGASTYPPTTKERHTVMEDKLIDRNRKRYNDDPISIDDKARIDAEKSIVDVLRKGDNDQAGKLFNAAIDKGLLARNDEDRIAKKVKMSYLEYNVSNMSLEEGLDIFLDRDCTKDERIDLATILAKKYELYMKQRMDEAKENKGTVPKYVYDRVLDKLEKAKKLGIVEMAQEKAKAATAK